MKKIYLSLFFLMSSYLSFAKAWPSDSVVYKDLKRLTSFLNYSVGTGGRGENIKLNQTSIAEANLPLEFSVQDWANDFKDWRSLKKNIDLKIGSPSSAFLLSYRAYIISSQSYFLKDNAPEAIALKINFINDLIKNGGKSFHVYYALLKSLKGKASPKDFKECLAKVLIIGSKTMDLNENILGKKFAPRDAEVANYGVAESTERINYYYHLIKKL